jgi:hypothetical protein
VGEAVRIKDVQCVQHFASVYSLEKGPLYNVVYFSVVAAVAYPAGQVHLLDHDAAVLYELCAVNALVMVRVIHKLREAVFYLMGAHAGIPSNVFSIAICCGVMAAIAARICDGVGWHPISVPPYHVTCECCHRDKAEQQ